MGFLRQDVGYIGMVVEVLSDSVVMAVSGDPWDRRRHDEQGPDSSSTGTAAMPGRGSSVPAEEIRPTTGDIWHFAAS